MESTHTPPRQAGSFPHETASAAQVGIVSSEAQCGTPARIRDHRRTMVTLLASMGFGLTLAGADFDPTKDIVEGTESYFSPIPIFFTAGGSIPPKLVVPLEIPDWPNLEDGGIPRVPLITVQHAYCANGDIDLAPFIPGGQQNSFDSDSFDPARDGNYFFGLPLENLRNKVLFEDMRAFHAEDHDYDGDQVYTPPGPGYVRMTCNVGARMLTGALPDPSSVSAVGEPAPTGDSGPTVVATNGKGIFLVTGPLATFWKEAHELTYEEWIARYGVTGSDAAREKDVDGDGSTNYEEFLSDTDPTDPSVTPQPLRLVDFQVVGDRAKFSWDGKPGTAYEVLMSKRLDEPQDAWTIVETFPSNAAASRLTAQPTLPPGERAVFFRVRIK